MITDDVIKALREANLIEHDEVSQMDKITATGEILIILYGIALINNVISQVLQVFGNEEDNKK